MNDQPAESIQTSHRFLDEAGDTTFFGEGRVSIIGQQGVSHAFYLGMVKFESDIPPIRQKIIELQNAGSQDAYFSKISSIARRVRGEGFYFHATDDPPEVRERLFRFIHSLDCSLEMVVGRKIPSLFFNKHHDKESEFYADLLSHLLKNKLQMGHKIVLNVAQKGISTRSGNLQLALEKAVDRFAKTKDRSKIESRIVFNVQNHRTEPLLNIADYLCWTIQRVFEKGETRYYDFLREKVALVVDLYDSAKYQGSRNFYTKANPLTAQNKISPPSP